MSNKRFAISIELPSAPWRCGQDHGSRGLPGSACRSRVRGRAPLRVMSTLACCRAQPPCNHRRRAPPGRRTKTRAQNKHGTDTQWDICVHVPMWRTTKNTRLLLVHTTIAKLLLHRQEYMVYDRAIIPANAQYTSCRIMRATKRPILPSQERTCLRLFRSAILSHCLRKDTHLPAKLKAQHVPYHTL